MDKIHCLQCKKYAENKNITVLQASNGRTMISAHCMCLTVTQSRFLKQRSKEHL